MIVVFGSINVDLVIRAEALPRPGETVLAPGYAVAPGGKGANQAVAAARAGADVHMAGCVGADGFAAPALATLSEAGVDLGAVREVKSPTGLAMICVNGEGRNQIAVASGANREARAGQLAAHGPHEPHGLLGTGTTLVLQLELDPGETWEAAARARAAGARVLLNTAPAAPIPAKALENLDVLVMNEIEAAMLAEAAGLAAEDPVEAGRGLAAAWRMDTVVTLGAGGAMAFTRDATWRVGALHIEPVDTTAAGDAFTGVLAATLDGGADLARALHRASVAGGLACTAPGAQPSLPTADAIEAALPRLSPAERV
jgi:ribokinase